MGVWVPGGQRVALFYARDVVDARHRVRQPLADGRMPRQRVLVVEGQVDVVAQEAVNSGR